MLRSILWYLIMRGNASQKYIDLSFQLKFVDTAEMLVYRRISREKIHQIFIDKITEMDDNDFIMKLDSKSPFCNYRKFSQTDDLYAVLMSEILKILKEPLYSNYGR